MVFMCVFIVPYTMKMDVMLANKNCVGAFYVGYDSSYFSGAKDQASKSPHLWKHTYPRPAAPGKEVTAPCENQLEFINFGMSGIQGSFGLIFDIGHMVFVPRESSLVGTGNTGKYFIL